MGKTPTRTPAAKPAARGRPAARKTAPAPAPTPAPAPAPASVVAPRKRPRAKASTRIAKLQRSSALIIPRATFRRMARAIVAEQYAERLTFPSVTVLAQQPPAIAGSAFDALQHIVESELHNRLRHARMFAEGGRRITVEAADYERAAAIRCGA